MHEHLTLTNIARGMAPKLFNRELQKVLENIQDTRTAANKPRKITLEITIKPDQDRHQLAYDVRAKSSLVSAGGIQSVAFASLDHDGNPIATVNDPEQLSLMDQLKSAQGDGE